MTKTGAMPPPRRVSFVWLDLELGRSQQSNLRNKTQVGKHNSQLTAVVAVKTKMHWFNSDTQLFENSCTLVFQPWVQVRTNPIEHLKHRRLVKKTLHSRDINLEQSAHALIKIAILVSDRTYIGSRFRQVASIFPLLYNLG